MGTFIDKEVAVSTSTRRRNERGPDNHDRLRTIEWLLAEKQDPVEAKANLQKMALALRLKGLVITWYGKRRFTTTYGPVKGNAPSDLERPLKRYGICAELVDSDEECTPDCPNYKHHPNERWDNDDRKWVTA
jgi:hypothetical protein